MGLTIGCVPQTQANAGLAVGSMFILMGVTSAALKEWYSKSTHASREGISSGYGLALFGIYLIILDSATN